MFQKLCNSLSYFPVMNNFVQYFTCLLANYLRFCIFLFFYSNKFRLTPTGYQKTLAEPYALCFAWLFTPN